MTNVKYGPGVIEFYAPDSFERGELSFTTMDNAIAAKGTYVLTDCDLTFEDSADSTAYGLAAVSRVDVARDRIGELEEKVKELASAIEISGYGVVDLEKVKARRETRMEKLRRELRTLQIAF